MRRAAPPGRTGDPTRPCSWRDRSRPDAGGEPDPALFVHHRIVDAGVAVPDRLLAPEHRRSQRVIRGAWRFRIEIGMLDELRRVVDGIEHRHEIRALFRRAVDHAVGVDRRVSLVGRNRVVQIHLRLAPVPRLITTLRSMPVRTLRLVEGKFARGDSIGPVREHLVAAVRPKAGDGQRHVVHGLAGLQAALPHLDRIFEFTELLHVGRADVLAAKRVAGLAGILDGVDPGRLASSCRPGCRCGSCPRPETRWRRGS